jgi:flagellar basal body-associated protein FliL
MSSESVIPYTLTDKERARVDLFIDEALTKMQTIFNLFEPRNSRNCLQMMLVMAKIEERYPGMVKRHSPEMRERIAEWFAAGEPEQLSTVPSILLAKFGKEEEN